VKTFLKWTGIVLGGLVGLLLLAALGVYIASEMRINRVYAVGAEPIAIPGDPASIERGRHLVVNLLACVDCHGADLGGKAKYIDDPLLGTVSTANLTRGKGGVGGHLRDADFVRAIRHGVKPDGRSLVVMPVDDYVHLNADDLAAVIAYIKSVPPVDNELPPNRVGLLARLLMVTNQANLLSAESVVGAGPPPPVIAPAPTEEYGRYLARTTGCMGCHGPTLSGGRIPGAPPNFPAMPNITPAGAVQGYSDDDLVRVIREGKRPGGAPISDFMPWKYYSGMTDREVRAIIAYLRSVPPREYGNR
jgi:mono/diheme cytochrome c family protein